MLAGKKLIKTVWLLGTLVLLTACDTVNHKLGAALSLDTDLKLEIIADKYINPDEQEQSSPVFIRLYELTSAKQFERADFIDLYERDEETLGDTFVSKQELKRIVPSTSRTERFVLSKDTRYIALFAEFYRYKDARTKVIFPVTASNVVRNSILIKVKGNSLSWESGK